MGAYLVRRLVGAVVALFLVTIIVFFSVRFIPGTVVDLMVQDYNVRQPTNIEEIEAKLGLDVPIYVQYGRWMGGIITRGDFGTSIWTGLPVLESLKNRLPISAELGVLAIIIALVLALPIGVYSAIRQDTLGDYVGRSIAIIFICAPGFWIGTMVMVFPSVWWGWAPSMQYIPFTQDPIGNLQMFSIPALILGMAMAGTTMRMTRTMMLEVLGQDYIRTAWAKGLRERTVIIRHALRNALIPVITTIGIQIPVVIGGSLILESIFNLPGMGSLMLQILTRRDYPVVSGVNLFVAAFVLVVNTVIDLTYAYLDPRIHYK
ncbi:MAG: ABC transporter permease [Dehalococcoidales bacterium]|nr:ABC transporter permease [Dehalococcoidales bacterium]